MDVLVKHVIVIVDGRSHVAPNGTRSCNIGHPIALGGSPNTTVRGIVEGI